MSRSREMVVPHWWFQAFKVSVFSFFFNFPYWYKTATFCLEFFQRCSQFSKCHYLLPWKYQIFFRLLHQRSGHPTYTTHPTYSSHPIHPNYPSQAGNPSHPCHFSHPSHPNHSCHSSVPSHLSCPSHLSHPSKSRVHVIGKSWFRFLKSRFQICSQMQNPKTDFNAEITYCSWIPFLSFSFGNPKKDLKNSSWEQWSHTHAHN